MRTHEYDIYYNLEHYKMCNRVKMGLYLLAYFFGEYFLHKCYIKCHSNAFFFGQNYKMFLLSHSSVHNL